MESIIDLIKTDHVRASEFFTKISQEGYPSQLDYLDDLEDELRIHLTVEEAVFYSEMENRGADLSHAEEEHKGIKVLLEELNKSETQKDSGVFSLKLGELRAAVEHHVQEEESKILPQAQQLFTKEGLESLGQDFQNAKNNKKDGW